MKLFLVGYSGCGKTSLARRVARVLRYEYFDTDAVLEQREGAAVADIFRYEGEAYFRKIESELLDEIIGTEGDMVVSTGGGLAASGDNMERMNRDGVTIYIRRSAEQIVARLSPYGKAKRPRFRGLNDEELTAFIRGNIAEREPRYALAKHTYNTAGVSDQELVTQIINDIAQ